MRSGLKVSSASTFSPIPMSLMGRPVTARMIRSSLLEVMSEDYIRTARAKGVFENLVVSRHALRNALLPVVTTIGLQALLVTFTMLALSSLSKSSRYVAILYACIWICIITMLVMGFSGPRDGMLP